LISISEYRALFPLDANTLNTAISIGNFDAVHKGHVALIHAAREVVGEGGRIEMWSFDPSPVSVLRPEVHLDRITTFSQRSALLIEAGADLVKRIVPTPELLSLEPKAYIEQITNEVSPTFIVEGAGFRFGKQRKGTIATLQELGDQFNFVFIEVEGEEVEFKDKGAVKISSSLVRQLLHEGRMRDVSAVLGRQYELTGVVTKGDCRGRELGFPTANLSEIETMLPGDGIYAGSAVVQGESYVAAISVGTKPTFGNNERTCEVHLIGFDGEIGQYDWSLTVTISHWIREQVKFDSVELLTIAIEQDILKSVELIES